MQPKDSNLVHVVGRIPPKFIEETLFKIHQHWKDVSPIEGHHLVDFCWLVATDSISVASYHHHINEGRNQ